MTVGGPVVTSRSGQPRVAEFALLVGAWLCLAVPQLAQVLLVGRGFVPVTEGREVPATVEMLTSLGNGVLVLGCAVLVVTHVRRVAWRTWPVLALLLAPWLVSCALLLAAGRPPGLPVLLYPALVTAAWVVRPRAGAVAVLGGTVAVTAALSIALGVVMPDRALYAGYEAADLDKSLGEVGILAGLLPSGNNLGLCLAVGLPAVACLRSRRRWPMLAVTVLAIAWSFSRTAWLAVLAALVVWALVRFGRRPWLVATALGGLLAVVTVVPFTVSSVHAFANRGGFWIDALADWRASPLIGKGPDWFDVVATAEDNQGGHAYHAHHQVVHALVTGGIVLAAVTLAVLVAAIVRAVRLAEAGAAWAAATVAALVTVSLLEVPFGSVDRTAFYPYVLLALCLVLLVPAEPDRVDADWAAADWAAAARGTAGRAAPGPTAAESREAAGA